MFRGQALLRHLDYVGLVCLSVAVTALIVALKQAPDHGWGSPRVLALLATSGAFGLLFARRCLTHDNPVAHCERSGGSTGGRRVRPKLR